MHVKAGDKWATKYYSNALLYDIQNSVSPDWNNDSMRPKLAIILWVLPNRKTLTVTDVKLSFFLMKKAKQTKLSQCNTIRMKN